VTNTTEDHDDSQSFWDAHYTRHPDVWSGDPNPVLVDELADRSPGTALDLGCGEGSDAIWLAGRGWRVTAVDVSAVALTRAAERAEAAGVADRITWDRHDLDETFPVGSFDLVTAHYLHSPQHRQPRRLLDHAVRAVADGGTLLLVGHASVAPWSWDPHAPLPSAREVLDGLHLETGAWTVVVCEDRPRQSVGPAGESATVLDSVVHVTRTR
jgi:SAM-dependent methyltransferase